MLGKGGASRPALSAQGRRERGAAGRFNGGYCSLWLLRSISSTSRSYDTKLLESNNRGKSLLQNTLHSVVHPTCSYTVINICSDNVCLCVSPNVRLAVIRPVRNSNTLTT